MLKKNLKSVTPHGHLGGFFFRLFRGGTTFQATAGGCKKHPGKEEAPEGDGRGIGLCTAFPSAVSQGITPGGVEARQAGGCAGCYGNEEHPCRSRCSLRATRAGKCLNTEDAPPEREGKTSAGRRMGVAITGKSRDDRYGRASHHVESENTWSHVRHDFPMRVRIPHEVTVGIRLVMRGIMRVLGLPVMVMVVVGTRVRCLSVGVRWPEMRKERKRRASTSRMVNKHMR